MASKMKATIKEKVALAEAEAKEALGTTKVNMKMAADVAMHPFDKEKKAVAKEQAAAKKDEVKDEKVSRLEEAHLKKQVALGQAPSQASAQGAARGEKTAATGAAVAAQPHKDSLLSSSSSSSSESESELPRAGAVETDQQKAGTVPEDTETPPNPTEPIFMAGA